MRGEADFRHQYQRLSTTGQDRFDQAQVDLGFAATGDPFQQEDLKASLFHRDRRDCCNRRRLSLVQDQRQPIGRRQV